MKDDEEDETKSMATTTSQQPPRSSTPMTFHRRRNSLVFATPLRTLSLPPIKDGCHGFAFPNGTPLSSQPPSFDVGLTPHESTSSMSYTSLRDLISSAAMSSPASSCCQIPIRNRLVKQAAWAYLQPMSSSSFTSSSRSQLFFNRLWDCVSSWCPLDRLSAYVEGRFIPAIQKILDRIRHTVRWLIAR